MSAPPINLLPGEVVIRHAHFTPRLILTYLKTTIILTDMRVVRSSPNTIFGVVPYGYSTHATPLEAATDVTCGNGRETGVIGKFVIYALLLCLVAAPLIVFAALMDVALVFITTFIFIIVALVALWILSAKTFLTVHSSSGAILSTGTSVGERAMAEDMYGEITAAAIRARQKTPGTPVPVSGPPPPVPHPGRPAGPPPPVPAPALR